ncbi:unnamed protein product [Ceutorhynchus assimilis]|uniref:SWIM-type domain-containing protein n=1 Tax=Ceutorhynchus assimilis TaxID=467358 RepID=A0A9N9QJU5_9CUCU|nr:unnamed protein product [Ceutorhynchus assimilis]
MTESYCKGQSDNLPRIDSFMVVTFLQNNPCFTLAEIKGVKAGSAGREQYGDAAIRYVQLKRNCSKCISKCKICPEYKLRNKQYSVELVVDEELETMESVQCMDCAASAGSCKHAIAFLMWLHRRSEEPASTSVTNYWKKSSLSKVGASLKYVKTNNFRSKKHEIENVPSQFFATFCAKRNFFQH